MLLASAWLLWTGCSSSGSAKVDGGRHDADRSVVYDGSVALARCPNGATPGDADAVACPQVMPEAGSCCAVHGLACFYPGDDTTYRRLAVCVDDSNHPLFWMQTLVIDRVLCAAMVSPIQLGSTGAPACAARETIPCHACNCAPGDSICVARCGHPSGTRTPQMELAEELDSLIVQTCGELPNESSVQVRFANGCATALDAQMPGPPGTFATLVSCIGEALDRVHFECADSLECAGTGRSTLY